MTSLEFSNTVIFGPQRGPLNPNELSRLRLSLLGEPDLVGAIRDLPKLWSILLLILPNLSQVPALKVFEEFDRWLEKGEPPKLSRPLANTLLTPLSVISDVLNGIHYLRLRQMRESSTIPTILSKMRTNGGFHGLCTGLLAALAFASSDNESMIRAHAAVALRLGVCIGAIVDLESTFCTFPNEACCLVLRCEPKLEPEINKMLQDFPEVSPCPIGLWEDL